MNEWEWQLLEDKTSVDELEISGVKVRAGDRVRLRPKPRGDVLDIALAGQSATIESLEQDYEGKCHVCVVLDDDPGKDLGLLRQPGHRFFFDAAEVEPIPGAITQPARNHTLNQPGILVAGIGNIFLGDDGFGVEVARRMAGRALPAGVRVADYGIRGFDLAYALQDGYDTVILVDACPQGGTPGTLFVMEPDLDALEHPDMPRAFVETHGMNPVNVLRMAKAMNASLHRVLVVGCEPATLGGEEGHMGLSSEVEAAVDEAIQCIESLLHKFSQQDCQSSKPDSGSPRRQ